jgi:hypothetical protein
LNTLFFLSFPPETNRNSSGLNGAFETASKQQPRPSISKLSNQGKRVSFSGGIVNEAPDLVRRLSSGRLPGSVGGSTASRPPSAKAPSVQEDASIDTTTEMKMSATPISELDPSVVESHDPSVLAVVTDVARPTSSEGALVSAPAVGLTRSATARSAKLRNLFDDVNPAPPQSLAGKLLFLNSLALYLNPNFL